MQAGMQTPRGSSLATTRSCAFERASAYLCQQVPCKNRHADGESSVLLQLAKYHEQAQLLDPHLHGIVVPLSAQLRKHAGRGSQGASWPSVLTISRFLWDLVTVRQGTSTALLQYECQLGERSIGCPLPELYCVGRGYKTVVKAFSSEVADLEPVLALLLRCDAQVR